MGLRFIAPSDAILRFAVPGGRAEEGGAGFVACRIMNWLVWLGLAVVIAAVAAVTGIKPKGTRPVSHSRLMGIGRLALLAIVIILVYAAFRAHAGS
jgi:hypothetical protein